MGFGSIPWHPTYNALSIKSSTHTLRLDNWSFTGPTANQSIIDHRWHYIAGTFDGKISKLFVDGALQSERSNVVYNAGGNDHDFKFAIGTFWAHDDVSLSIAEVTRSHMKKYDPNTSALLPLERNRV